MVKESKNKGKKKEMKCLKIAFKKIELLFSRFTRISASIEKGNVKIELIDNPLALFLCQGKKKKEEVEPETFPCH